MTTPRKPAAKAKKPAARGPAARKAAVAKPGKRGGGRPAFVPNATDRGAVKALVGFGIQQPEIARHLGVSVPTLRKHFKDEIATGLTAANATVAGRLYALTGGKGREAVTACIFWLKTRAGWRETDVVEVTGPDGAPLLAQSQVTFFQIPDNGRGTLAITDQSGD